MPQHPDGQHGLLSSTSLTPPAQAGGTLPSAGLGAPASEPPIDFRPDAAQLGANEEEPNVTPEEQAEYEKIVGRGMQLIFSDRLLPKLM